MDTININKVLVETYLSLLMNLSSDNKLELISKLSQSMKVEKNQELPLKELFGRFISEKTAEEQIEEIRSSRIFNRKNEEF